MSNAHLAAVIRDRKQAIERVSEVKKVDTLNGMMDHVERVIHACGGDQRCSFLDVSRDFIKIHSRITSKMNVFPDTSVPDSENPRIHKTVAKILMDLEQIQSVRWLPREDGAFLIVSFDLDKKGEK
ncbi:hypothetical protein [Bacillus phage SPO1L4]|uniref:Uncharacterized protein n=1 Tax=Bacillus phage vB_BsuM-Goe2 TaxID=1933062 RepID=A0A1Z1D9F0_9CAUD|nr:hypothetical protein Goe2_c15900 [Bacillus phage vB_BsuM-Goe2]WCS68797.1 hypothetical protein Goe19_01560 [Bacillus phage vB_BsuM-Goe19]WIT26492.1 hypothetical protein [Bacillus phage SPO1L4]